MSFNSIQPGQEDPEPEIDPIRVELLSTELPIHQIAKRGEESIRILKRKSGRLVELQWKVDYNPSVGRPGQLAYRLDTWVIRRRLSELPRPIPRLVRIGDLREIARELKHGGDTNAIRRAFDQNAATFIRAKVTYRRQTGGENVLEGYFNRYNVFYSGHNLPDTGQRAETVYISLNDPYYGLINDSRVRPLDFAYMRKLTPGAQRFYELLSPRMFAAIRNTRSTAWIRYLEYCQYSVQKPQLTRSRMQAQMAAVHRYHRRSGYIAAVTYQTSRRDDGVLDWIIRYTPGPRARAEYRMFNVRKSRSSATKSARARTGAPIDEKRASERSTAPNSTASGTNPARFLAHQFAERRHGGQQRGQVTHSQIVSANSILDAAGGNVEIAKAAVDLGASEGRADRRGFPAHLSGVLEGGYVDRARGHHENAKMQRERTAEAERTRHHREEYEKWRKKRASDRTGLLTKADKRRLIDERLPAFTEKHRIILERKSWSDDERRTWTEKRILVEYGREGEPSYEEWSQSSDAPPLH